jgi:pimeloyl-ACP methyl ester carboxylesterase
MKRRLLLPSTMLTLAALVAIVSVLPRNDASASPLVPCEKTGVKGHVQCGKLEVFENRSDASGRRIPLNVVVLKAMNRDAASDPVFVLAGGPGQAATDFAARIGFLLNDVRQHRDIVLVDQRGTGESNGLECDELTTRDKLRFLLAEEMPFDVLERCRTKLARRADLTLYSTALAMDDLDDVREWLGYETVNLYGISYGTRAAAVYLQRHPERVRTMTLRAVHYGNMIHVPRDGQRALDRLFADCRRDTACSDAYPRLADEFAGLLERLESSPPTIRVSGRPGDRREKVPLTRNLFAGTVRQTLYTAESQSDLPLIIHTAHEGDYRPISRAIEQHLAIFESLSLGMFLSVHCPEAILQIPVDDIEEETSGTFMGGDFLREAIEACGRWPAGGEPHDSLHGSESEVPTLIISGEIDPVTPPAWGEDARRRYPNSSHLVLEGIAHDSPPPCALDAMTRLIESADPAGLDDSCTGETSRPRFNVRR